MKVHDYLKLQAYHDSDLGRDLVTRHSINASLHELNGVAISWTCKKHPKVSEHSNGSEIRSLFQGVHKSSCIRNF